MDSSVTERKRMLAEEALKLAKRRIRRKLPVMGSALEVPRMEWTDRASGTDAEALYWNAGEVLSLFGQSMERLERMYLHQLLHGMYLQRFRRQECPENVWWLACDIMTEYRIDRMHVPGFARPIPQNRSRWYRKIQESGAAFQEQCLTVWIRGRKETEFQELERIFRRDSHIWWKNETVCGSVSGEKEHRMEHAEKSLEAIHRWRAVFEQLELKQEEHRRQAGGSAGARVEQIVLQKERGYDYRQFLKRFAVEQEELSVDMDSFDYIPYDYSRKMYERLVLLEPLEYKNIRRIQEFVIAIDTSGSCSGEVVKRFLTETWEIFQEKENFFQDMRIHLIQCDCMVQEHVCMTCEEEWTDYLEHMTVKGHGDTDFTPVFLLVERMIQNGGLKNLKGLLYFTDGDGIYPERKPDYDTAFVFLNEELRKGRAPDWALTLTLDIELEI